jgi:serine/threonine protein kinase
MFAGVWTCVLGEQKPDNVGFSAEGAVKLFDFGLAKKLLEVDKVGTGMESDLYLLTGNTGSLRYMAPEVALGRPYNNKVDSYSFGILFWQICALALPYAGYDVDMHAELVVDQGYRPRLDDSWPGPWIDLMSNCWGSDIHARPDFDFIVQLMTQEVAEMKLEATESQNSFRQTATTDMIHHVQSFGSAEKVDTSAAADESMDMHAYDSSRVVNNLKGNTETDSIMAHHDVC